MTNEEFRRRLEQAFGTPEDARIVPLEDIHLYSRVNANKFKEIFPDKFKGVDPLDLMTVISLTVQNVLYDNTFDLEAIRATKNVLDQKICLN